MSCRRWHSRLWVVAVLLLAPPAVPAAPGRPVPNRTPAVASPATARFEEVEYLDVTALLTRWGFAVEKTNPQAPLRRVLRQRGRAVELETDKRDIQINGTRVFLGEPILLQRGLWWISRADAEKVLKPLFRPAEVAGPEAPRVRRIMLDAGHGGQDAGTQNRTLKLQEKNFTLDVVGRLRRLLVEQGYEVLLTRTDDRYIGLAERAEAANAANADVFISIHFNATESPTVTGSETYVLSSQFQRSTSSIAREANDNRVLPGNRMDPWNTLLGFEIHRRLIAKLRTTDRGLKKARFVVLSQLRCPGVLVEAGFLSNTAEAQKLSSPAYRDDIAEAVAAGVSAYIETVGRKVTR